MKINTILDEDKLKEHQEEKERERKKQEEISEKMNMNIIIDKDKLKESKQERITEKMSILNQIDLENFKKDKQEQERITEKMSILNQIDLEKSKKDKQEQKVIAEKMKTDRVVSKEKNLDQDSDNKGGSVGGIGVNQISKPSNGEHYNQNTNNGGDQHHMLIENEINKNTVISDLIKKFLFGHKNEKETPVDFINNLPEEIPS